MYQYIILPHFLRQLKPLTKKYHHLKEAVISCLQSFQKEQQAALGHGLYKVRLKSKDLPKGKSKSFRLIVYVIEVESLLAPVTIYFKGDKQDISKKELNDHLEMALVELWAENRN